MSKKNVVVIGGGHGQSIILKGIKDIEDIDLSAIVTVADDGGSTGRLRRHFHIPAMGDIRNVMVALSNQDSVFSGLMDYRFEEFEEELDVGGHNLGNLILTALTESSGSFMGAIETLSDLLNVKGKIIPASLQIITLFARMEDGTIVKGEANIPNFNNRIIEVFYDKKVNATLSAIRAIKNADLIIYGIGSLYTSILPNLIIEDIDDAIKSSKAKKIYFCNVMSQPGETDGYCLEDHVNALNKNGANIEDVIVASDEIPTYILDRYLNEGSTYVSVRDKEHNYNIINTSLLTFKDDLIRHDPDKIKIFIEGIIKEL